MTPEQSLQILKLPNSTTSRWLKQLGEAHRHYHTLTHIEHMLAHLPATQPTREMIAAIWLHDIVYNPHASDNEEQSAAQAETDLATWPERDRHKVQRLIMATKHHDHTQTVSTAAHRIIDLDMLILGETPERYDAYAKAIRREYAHIPIDSYRINRAHFLEVTLEAGPIFHGSEFKAYEEQARANLAREIESLRNTNVG